jgi:hypothetical protein
MAIELGAEQPGIEVREQISGAQIPWPAGAPDRARKARCQVQSMRKCGMQVLLARCSGAPFIGDRLLDASMQNRDHQG